MRNDRRAQSVRRWLLAQQSLRPPLKKVSILVSSHDQTIVLIEETFFSRPRSTPKTAHTVFSRAYLDTHTRIYVTYNERTHARTSHTHGAHALARAVRISRCTHHSLISYAFYHFHRSGGRDTPNNRVSRRRKVTFSRKACSLIWRFFIRGFADCYQEVPRSQINTFATGAHSANSPHRPCIFRLFFTQLAQNSLVI